MTKILKIALVALLVFALVATPFAGASGNSDGANKNISDKEIKPTIKVVNEKKEVNGGSILKLEGTGKPDGKVWFYTIQENEKVLLDGIINKFKSAGGSEASSAKFDPASPKLVKAESNLKKGDKNGVLVGKDGKWEAEVILRPNLVFPNKNNIPVYVTTIEEPSKKLTENPNFDAFKYKMNSLEIISPQMTKIGQQDGYSWSIEDTNKFTISSNIPTGTDPITVVYTSRRSGDIILAEGKIENGQLVVDKSKLPTVIDSYDFYVIHPGNNNKRDISVGSKDVGIVVDVSNRNPILVDNYQEKQKLVYHLNKLKDNSGTDDIIIGPYTLELVKASAEITTVPSDTSSEQVIKGKMTVTTELTLTITKETKNKDASQELRINTIKPTGKEFSWTLDSKLAAGDYKVKVEYKLNDGNSIVNEKKFTVKDTGTGTGNTPKSPGFTIALALIGLGAVAFIAMRRRNL